MAIAVLNTAVYEKALSTCLWFITANFGVIYIFNIDFQCLIMSFLFLPTLTLLPLYSRGVRRKPAPHPQKVCHIFEMVQNFQEVVL